MRKQSMKRQSSGANRARKRKESPIAGALITLLGIFCAVILGALFYGAMAYQMADGQADTSAADWTLLGAKSTPLPLDVTADVEALFPGALLALDETSAELLEESAQDEMVGGQVCRVVTRSYALAGGTPVQAISASPAAYLERLSEPDCEPQLITGFVIDDLDAVYVRRGDTAILAARDGETIYLVEAQVDETTLYALGAMARRAQQTDGEPSP